MPRELELREVGKRKIVYSDIDYNMHMNNTRYPDMICDYIEELSAVKSPMRIKSLSLSYLKESALGATLTVSRSEIDESGMLYVRTTNEQGEPCLESCAVLEKL